MDPVYAHRQPPRAGEPHSHARAHPHTEVAAAEVTQSQEPEIGQVPLREGVTRSQEPEIGQVPLREGVTR